METYWGIALEDYENAIFAKDASKNKMAVFYFQQFAEKGAKALLEKIDPEHTFLKSHRVENILAAYDKNHRCGELSDKARYLTSFYFDTRYPGDNYVAVIDDIQMECALRYANALKEYFENELEKLEKSIVRKINGLEGLR